MIKFIIFAGFAGWVWFTATRQRQQKDATHYQARLRRNAGETGYVFIPLGSLVKLADMEGLFIIYRRGVLLDSDDVDKEVYYDYAAVPYPVGLTDDPVTYFDRDGVEAVIAPGYHDEEDKD
ncbi:MAG: DUF4176 domain-containing protein [Lactobacillus sp.]|nr:DUF4176 domain-containing protein [Lactobacillus sp.]MCI2032693.1 DUF4176 domain-containing protein [Lactobacillus sp.]